MKDLTSEKFASTGITVYQPARGHRYGEESIALAEFARVLSGDRVCELGSGVAVTALQIAARYRPASVVAVEIQSELHDVARLNVIENGFGKTVECVNEDMREFAKSRAGSFDVVVSNPPFFTAGDGRLPPCPVRASARHELHGTIEDFITCAHTLLKDDGRFFVVFDKKRKKELVGALPAEGFEVVRIEEPKDTAYILIEYSKKS
jgi:tRNA1Val (adenine37-N6)-methyltransferase